MRKASLPFVIILALFYSKCFSQSISDTSSFSKVRGTLKFYPLQIPFGELRLMYEVPLTPRVSLEVGGSFIYGMYPALITYQNIGQEINEGSFNGFPVFFLGGLSLRGGCRFYGKENKSGFYFNPLAFAKYMKYPYESFLPYNDNIYNVGLQLLIGYKFRSRGRTPLEIYTGVGGRLIYDEYSYNHVSAPKSTKTDKYSALTFQIGFIYGYEFHP